MNKLTLLAIAALAAPTANAVVIYDTLYNEYTNGNGNCLGGSLIFGGVYDLEMADDISLATQTTITAVSVRNLTFGVASATQAYLRIFRDDSGGPGTEVTGPEGDLVPVTETEFSDPIFDLVGKDVHASGLNYTLEPGTYWIGLQVISDDWHYTGSGSYGMGANGHLRDGPRSYYSYIFYWWNAGTDYNMRVEGDVVPEPMTVVALGGGLIALLARRRK